MQTMRQIIRAAAGKFGIVGRFTLGLVAVTGLWSTPALAQTGFGIGGTQADDGRGVAVDGAGNIYLVGLFRQTADFDPGPGVFELTATPGTATFVASYTANGALRFAISIQASGNIPERGIAVDGSGNVYVTGWFSGVVDFDPGIEEHSLSSANGKLFVASYDDSGNYRFAFNIGGDNPIQGEFGTAIAVDDAGNSFITGEFSGETDFDPDEGEFLLQANGITDAFVAGYTSAGSFRFAAGFGGTGRDRGRGIAIDAAGNSYLTGAFRDTVDFDPGAGELLLESNGGEDIFVASYTDGGALRYAVSAGGPFDDIGNAVAIDPAHNAFVTGSFLDAAEFDPGPGSLILTAVANKDIFLASYSEAGALRLAFGVGSDNDDIGAGVAIDGAGSAHVTGSFVNSTDFDPGAEEHILSTMTGPNAFIASYSNDGAYQSAWSFMQSTTQSSEGRGIALDYSGRQHIIGSFGVSIDVDPGPAELPVSSNGADDAFFSSFSPMLADADGDGVADIADNCTLEANADQRDSDADGFGNLCDADLTNNCSVNFEDLGLMKQRFFGSDADADLDGDGTVNFVDLGIMKAGFFASPGPSALAICRSDSRL